MLSKETGFINLWQSLLLADDGTAAGMNMNGVYKLSDTTMDGFAFSATYRWSTAAISSSISLSILPNQLNFIAQLDSGIISTVKIGQITLRWSFTIFMSVNVYCKGERHGGHMSASSATLLMKYYDDNNTLTSTFDVTFERRQTAQLLHCWIN